MTTTKLDKRSIGKIAERIIMNELEARGYRVTDLNKDGLSANADLVAAKGGKVWQIQVKGATNSRPHGRWWVQYGHCTQEIIDGKRGVFNQKDSFYRAQYVALVAVKSPKDYRCFVMPIDQAEKLAQHNLNGYYRLPGRDGRIRKPGKMWRYIEKSPRERTNNVHTDKEREILHKWEEFWTLERSK